MGGSGVGLLEGNNLKTRVTVLRAPWIEVNLCHELKPSISYYFFSKSVMFVLIKLSCLESLKLNIT